MKWDFRSHVRSTQHLQDASLIKATLAEAGIEARVVGNRLLNAVDNISTTAVDTSVWVHAVDVEAARKIIEKRQAAH